MFCYIITEAGLFAPNVFVNYVCIYNEFECKKLYNLWLYCDFSFYPRWKEYESMQAETLHFTLDESQWQHDWAVLLSLASQPGRFRQTLHHCFSSSNLPPTSPTGVWVRVDFQLK